MNANTIYQAKNILWKMGELADKARHDQITMEAWRDAQMPMMAEMERLIKQLRERS